MNIDEMSEQEKSVMLARLVGWEVNQNNSPVGQIFIYYDRPRSNAIANLYDTANMALAWRVLNWFWAFCKPLETPQQVTMWDGYHADLILWMIDYGSSYEDMPPAEAQAAWLDKILELAIEAGMV